MKTKTQIYEEYIATQQARLEALEKQIVDTKKDIDNVRKLMLEYPNESNTER